MAVDNEHGRQEGDLFILKRTVHLTPNGKKVSSTADGGPILRIGRAIALQRAQALGLAKKPAARKKPATKKKK